MEEKVVDIQNLRKTYGSFAAIDGITFSVCQGEIFGLLGPNGAGKTTTLECLEGIRRPDMGKVLVMGIDPIRNPRDLRNRIGVQLQASGMPDTISVQESMRFFCAYHGIKPRYDLLKRMGLAEKMDAQYQSLSIGQKRRLALALAIAHNPPLIFLDEPTAGLDVESRVELHEVMRELQHDGITIILSSHDMAEVEKLTDRVAILLHGKIVAAGTPREITATGAGYTKVSVRTENASLSELSTLPGVRQKTAQEGYDVYYSTDPGTTVLALLEYIKEQQDTLIDLRVERPSLEDRFLEITAHKEMA